MICIDSVPSTALFAKVEMQYGAHKKLGIQKITHLSNVSSSVCILGSCSWTWGTPQL